MRTCIAFVIVAVVLSAAAAQEQAPPRAFDIEQVRRLAVQGGAGLTTDSDAVAQPRSLQPVRESFVPVAFRIAGYLTLVVVLIFAVSWLVRRIGRAGGRRATGGAMDLLEVLPMGANRSLMLVRAGDRVYFLGQTPDSITSLGMYEGDKAVELISSTKGGMGVTQFKEVFNSFVGRFRKSE